MKKFNQIITVSVAVDSIAEQLLANMNAEFKHAEIVVESIIGSLLSENKLSYLYNSLNGYSADINFKVGDKIANKNGYKAYAYWKKENRTEGLVTGEVTIEEISLFSDKKLKISFMLPNSEGDWVKSSAWVSHLDWDIVPKEMTLEQDHVITVVQS